MKSCFCSALFHSLIILLPMAIWGCSDKENNTTTPSVDIGISTANFDLGNNPSSVKQDQQLKDQLVRADKNSQSDGLANKADSQSGTTSDKPQVELTTSLGKITLELDAKKAPKTVENFLDYARSGFYNGTIFHRVISNFMIQGGGFDADMNRKTTKDPIINEATNGLSNIRGTIAMARSADPNSATAQFFINVVDNTRLDFVEKSEAGWGYCVFGKVIQGMEVVDAIKVVPTGTKAGYQDVPTTPVVISEAK